MKTERTSNYRPYKNGFPYKLLRYLYENGKSAGVDVQENIGMNNFFDKKGTIYFDRASSNFDSIARQLQSRELIQVLPDDCYELTKSGKQFVETYNVR